MPIRPEPTTYTCPTCGWSKTVAPRSDALMPGDFYAACPSCGNKAVESKAASATAAALALAERQIKQLLR